MTWFKKALMLFMVTIGLTSGSLAVSASPAEAEGRGRCHRVWHRGHVVIRCERDWRGSRSYSRPYSQSRPNYRHDYRRDR